MTLPYPPRAWIDWTVPTDDWGDEIGIASDTAGNLKLYVYWLADYLYRTHIPVPDCQTQLLEKYRQMNDVSRAIFRLSDTIGFISFELEMLELDIENGRTWEDINREQRSEWEDLSPSEKIDWSSDGNTFFLPQAVFDRVCSELEESQSVPDHIRHADVPYRPVLAALLNEVTDQAERFQLLSSFYRIYSENSMK